MKLLLFSLKTLLENVVCGERLVYLGLGILTLLCWSHINMGFKLGNDYGYRYRSTERCQAISKVSADHKVTASLCQVSLAIICYSNQPGDIIETVVGDLLTCPCTQEC